MSQENEKKQQELNAAYDWLPNPIREIVSNTLKGNEKVKTLIRDAYLNQGEEKIDGKWVVDPGVNNFKGRLETLLAEESECSQAAENIEMAARPPKLIKRVIDSLKAEMGKADDRTGEITIEEFVPIEVKKEDFPQLAEAVTAWLEKIWSLRNQSGLISEYMKRMSLLELEINGIKPAITFDEFANKYIRNLINRELSGLRMTILFRNEGLDNALNNNDGLMKLKKMDMDAIRDKAVEVAIDVMTDWQMGFSGEVESLEHSETELIERMKAARKLFDLVKSCKRTGDSRTIEGIKSYLEQISKK